MTTNETKSLHEVLNEAKDSANWALVKLINAVWDACDFIDPMCEWDDQSNRTILDALRGAGQRELADELAAGLGIACA